MSTSNPALRDPVPFAVTAGECFQTKIAPPLVVEFHISGRLTGNSTYHYDYHLPI